MPYPRRPARLAAALLALLFVTGALAFALWPADPIVARAIAAVPARDRPLRIAVLGTSLTARYQWPEALARALARCLPEPPELRVFAEPGRGSAWGRGEAAAVRDFAPDLVLIEFLANDANILRLRTVEASRANHRAIVAALRSRGADPAIALLTTAPPAGLRGLLRVRLPRFNAMYAALAGELGLGLVDTLPAWRAALDTAPSRTILPDGLHPTEAWQRRVMLESLLPPLGAALGGAYPGCRPRAGG